MAQLRQRNSSKIPGSQTTEPGTESKAPSIAGPLVTPVVSAFVILSTVRLCSAAYNNIADCDETFNFWEPTHYVLYGFGLQTWEHSPSHDLHSYAYVLPHALVAKAAGLINQNKVFVFYAVRAALGLFCATGEARFVAAASNRFGSETGCLFLLLLACSSGMFHASTAFLPSVFCMHMSSPHG